MFEPVVPEATTGGTVEPDVPDVATWAVAVGTEPGSPAGTPTGPVQIGPLTGPIQIGSLTEPVPVGPLTGPVQVAPTVNAPVSADSPNSSSGSVTQTPAAGGSGQSGSLIGQVQVAPAAKAGMLPGDVVIKLDGVEINGVDDLIRVLDRDRIGRRLAMDVLRLGRLQAIDIDPVERKPAR